MKTYSLVLAQTINRVGANIYYNYRGYDDLTEGVLDCMKKQVKVEHWLVAVEIEAESLIKAQKKAEQQMKVLAAGRGHHDH